VPEDCFKKCLSFFASNKKCAALGVRMLDGSGRFLKESKRGFPSPLTSFFKMAGLTALFPSSKLFARYYQGHLPQKQNNEVEVLAGAFMMLSKKAIDATRGFDENFFMYGEDVDLSYRIREAGMSNYYFADTAIIHFKGESTQKISSEYIEHFYGAMTLFVKKHYSEKKATRFFMSIAIGLSKILARIKMQLIKKEEPLARKPLATAVLAGQPKFDQCIQLIKYASPQILLVGRIRYSNDNGAAVGELDNIEECIRENKIKQLLFCEGEVSFLKIIATSESISGKAAFLFHANGSDSIAGSNNKNSRGIFIAKPSL
jgi:hypothetical protein